MSVTAFRRAFVQRLVAGGVARLIKPTSMAGGWSHPGYKPLAFVRNPTYQDFPYDFEKADPSTGKEQA
jgi:hypothetical protein